MNWRRSVDWQAIQNRPMDFWSQLPWSTRILLGVFGILLIVFVGLIFLRMGVLSVEKPLFKIFSNEERATQETTPESGGAQQAGPQIPLDVPALTALENVMILSGPGNDFPSIGILEQGQSAEIMGISQDGQWWAIKLPYVDGGRAWVAGDRVETRNTSLVPVISVYVPTKEPPTVTALANINVRSGPGLDFQRIGLLGVGQTAELLGVDEDGFWYFIGLFDGSGTQGWIAKDYAVARNPDDVPVVGTTPGAPTLVALVKINVRAGPGREYAIVGSLDKGQGAEVVGISADGEWFAIKFAAGEGSRGWVAAGFVNAKNVEGVPVLKN